MKTKCHYNGPEFVPCAEYKLLCIDAGLVHLGYRICPYCSVSLKKPEDEKPWWLAVGATLKNKKTLENSLVIQFDNNFYLSRDAGRYQSIITEEFLEDWEICGGPFDMIPEFQRSLFIIFRQDGSGFFNDEFGYTVADFPIWHNCPEEFKGKTFSLEGLK